MTGTAAAPRPLWVEIHGRKRRFETPEQARAFANRHAARTGDIIGIQCDHIGIGGFGYCTACGYRPTI